MDPVLGPMAAKAAAAAKRSKVQVKADADAALAAGAKVTVLPVRRKPTPQVDALPGMAPLGAKAKPAKASRAAAPKGPKAAAKAVAPKGGRVGRFASDGARLRPVADAPVRTGVLGHIQAAVARGAAFGAIRDSLAKEFAAAKADPQRFAVRFVGRAVRRGLVQLG